MQGFGVHTFRLINEGATRTSSSSTGTRGPAPIRSSGTRQSRSTAPTPISTGATCGKRSRPEPIPNTSSACRSSTRPTPTRFSFDVLDATKIVPEELVPLRPVGRMVLNRNPDNFFAETEQVAFGTQHVVPGIDFSNDPLLQAVSSPTSTRRSAVSAVRTSTSSRSTRRSRRRTTTNATACTAKRFNARTRQLRAELARRRLPVQAGMRASRSFPDRSTNQSAGQAGKLR